MDKLYIAKMMMHRWEEEPISGIGRGYKGTFAIFFYGCNLHCIYCQNSKISRAKVKDIKNEKAYEVEELAKLMIEAESNGAASVSFITGVFYIDKIVETIRLARSMGLKIPVVYNSSGYEMASHIKKLDGLVDIYLPDFKYYDDAIGKKFSGISNYKEIATECIDEMYRQVGTLKKEPFRGVIVRHLILPGHTEDSKKVIKYLYDRYKNNIQYSIMSQYTPMLKNADIEKYDELTRKLTKREYDKVVDFAISLGIENAFVQEGDVAKDSFIPEF